MAGESIDNAAIIQFSSEVHVAAQQGQARLRSKVKVKPMTGDVFAYDGLGQVEASEIHGRHQKVVFSDPLHTRRKISRRRFSLTLPVDASDVRGALISPSSQYASVCAKAMERVFDRVVIESQFLTVLTGRDFGASVAYASDDGNTINATAGLTYEKLLEIRQFFIDNEIGNEMPVELSMGITGKEHTALMKETELVSGDFSREYVIDEGHIVKAAGINLILFGGSVAKPMLPVSGGTRDCFVSTNDAMCVGISKNMELEIEKRSDLIGTTQVQINFELGAVRTEGLQIQKVQTTA